MKIYKYTPHINLFIKSSTLKITPTYQLNDPFESRLTDDFIDEAVAHSLKTFGSRPTEILVAPSLKESGKYTGIISFTTDGLDLRMWGYYTESYQGGVLEFDTQDISLEHCNNETSLFDKFKPSHFGQVNYDNERQMRLQDVKFNYLREGVHFQKAKEWMHECEIRAVGNYKQANLFTISTEDVIKLYIQQMNNLIGFSRIINWELKTNNEPSVQLDNELGETIKKPLRRMLSQLFSEEYFILNADIFMCTITPKAKEEVGDASIIASSQINRIIDNKANFHPLVRIKRESLTGIILGHRFPKETLPHDLLKGFTNLKNNIKIVQPNPRKFCLDLMDL